MLYTALRVLARCWPALLLWFLLGWTIRALILRGGGYLLNIDENFGLLVLPLAVLAMLAAYVGMFLSVRRELPHLGIADDVERGEVAAKPVTQWRDSLLAAILPFFLLYVAWNLVRADTVDLYFASLSQDNFGTNDPTESITPVSVTIIVVAFTIRWLLGRFSARLPRWTTLLATYFEALWVLVALGVIRDILVVVGAWFSTRQMFGWAVDWWAGIREAFAWIGVIGDAFGWIVSQVGTVVGLPLAWLAFASIIYFGTMPRSVRPAPASARSASERWSRLPVWVRAAGTAVVSGVLDRWRPVALAARLIWRSGPIALGAFLLAFALTTAGGEWLRMLAYRLLGPHETNWWYGASDVVGLGVATVVAVLQVALVAAAFDHALRSDAAQELVEDAGDAVSSAAAPAAAPPRS
ncbi:hypothetical protein [Pseudolysinimonas sp.]